MTVRLDEPVYKAQRGSHYSDEDARIIGPVIDRLADEGRSTAREVLEEARPAFSPLHPYLEWDDSKAAEQYRMDQAGYMVRSIRIVVHTDHGEIAPRAFLPVTVKTATEEEPYVPKGRRYLPLRSIMDDPLLASQILKQAYDSALAWRNRYFEYQDLLGEPFEKVFQAIEHLPAI